MNDKVDHWQVLLTNKANKSLSRLPHNIQDIAARLFKELEKLGPERHNWKNYKPLSAVSYHCHLKKGKPTYVACWRVENKRIKIVEVYYVGTHEGAPY